MTRYVGLLRGVNVGGIRMTMKDLADTVRTLGYDSVRTVLASGNVLFETDDDRATAKRRLEQALRERFEYEAWVHVLTVDELRRIADGYPFERTADRHAYVVSAPDAEVRAAILAVPLDASLERVEEGDGVVYWTIPKGMTLETAFSKAQGSKAAKPHVTNRNLNTVEKLLA